MKKMKINSFFKSLQTHRFQHLSLLLAVAIIVSLQLTACKAELIPEKRSWNQRPTMTSAALR